MKYLQRSFLEIKSLLKGRNVRPFKRSSMRFLCIKERPSIFCERKTSMESSVGRTSPRESSVYIMLIKMVSRDMGSIAVSKVW